MTYDNKVLNKKQGLCQNTREIAYMETCPHQTPGSVNESLLLRKCSSDVLAVPGFLAWDVLTEMIIVTVKDLFGDAQELLPKKDSMFFTPTAK